MNSHDPYCLRCCLHKRVVILILIINILFDTSNIKISAATDNLTLGIDYDQELDLPVNSTKLLLENEAQSLDSSTQPQPQEGYEDESENVVDRLEHRTGCDFPVIENPNDYLMGTVELLQKAGYKAEAHYVTSEDGYISQIHRIPAPGKPVVYTIHGIFQSSRDMIMNCKGRALAHKLFNDGYDVWLGNIRGNSYSRNHTTLSPDSRAFWSWGIDEVSMYDGPAAIDYILKNTGQQKLNIIGYSLGSAILFGMLSARPEYNEKVNLGITMANSVFMSNTKSLPLRFLAPIRKLVETFFYIVSKGEAFSVGLSSMFHALAPDWCQLISKSRPEMCPITLWYFDGHDTKQINHAYIPLTSGGAPDSTSARIVGHSLQTIAKGVFTKYDYGFIRNIFVYGSLRAPAYDISKIDAPIINYWAENDFVATKTDAMILGKNFPLRQNIRVNWKDWNHFDYLYGKDADILVYDRILKDLKQWNHPTS